MATGSWSSQPQPQFRCPKCLTEVTSPTAGLVLYIDNLEDYRKNLVLQESQARSFKTVLGGFAPELPADHIPGILRRLRILDAMTLEERLNPDRIGPAERERITNDGGATRDEVEQLLNEFAGVRKFYREYREMPASTKVRMVLKGQLIALVWLLIPVGLGVLASFNAVVASGLSFLGYYLVSVLVVFLCLTRVKGAKALVLSSWPRLCTVLIAIPAGLAAALFVLVHDHVAGTEAEIAPVILGCSLVWMLSMFLWAQISTHFLVRRMIREQKAAVANALASSQAPHV